jgi:hypothetical protein
MSLHLGVMRPEVTGFGAVFDAIFSNPVLLADGVNEAVRIATSADLVVAARGWGRSTLGSAVGGGVAVLVAGQEGFRLVATSNNLFSFGTEMAFLAPVLARVAVLVSASARRTVSAVSPEIGGPSSTAES